MEIGIAIAPPKEVIFFAASEQEVGLFCDKYSCIILMKKRLLEV